MILTKKDARRVLEVVDVGLVKGLGEPKPGRMCVEAAICYALDLPHSDKPKCVAECIRSFKIKINDAVWSSNKARAVGMRRAAIAQLGSKDIDQKAWVAYVVEQTIRRILPIALRAAAKLNLKHKDSLEASALNCEKEGTKEAAEAANAAANAAAYAANAAAYAANAATYAANAATYAANAAANAANAAAYAAYTAAYAANAAAYAAYTAYTAANAAYTAANKRDKVLSLAAEICVEACIKCKTQGSKWLDITE